jgi:hypothetical protein
MAPVYAKFASTDNMKKLVKEIQDTPDTVSIAAASKAAAKPAAKPAAKADAKK